MALVGYHASHEQYSPRELLGHVKHAESAGFRGAMCSDHFFPWSLRQAQSGYAWSWLGSALQGTDLPFGVVNAPGQRYHPAVIAQAAATLAEMFPDRFWIALGSGQALSEHITGDPWPPKPQRQARLKECVDVIRALWAGETVTHEGLVRVKEARLYSRPAAPPRLVGAAVSAETAEWVGSWADAMITVVKPPKELAKVVDAFCRGGGEGKPMILQAQTSYAKTEDEARRNAHDQWRNNTLDCSVLTEVETPEEFDRLGNDIRPEDLDDSIHISADVKRHIDWLHEAIGLGFDEIYIHQVGRNQEEFLDVFGEHVLPALQAG